VTGWEAFQSEPSLGFQRKRYVWVASLIDNDNQHLVTAAHCFGRCVTETKYYADKAEQKNFQAESSLKSSSLMKLLTAKYCLFYLYTKIFQKIMSSFRNIALCTIFVLYVYWQEIFLLTTFNSTKRSACKGHSKAFF